MRAKIESIQWLRALASIVVVFIHTQGYVGGMLEKHFPNSAGAASVTSFHLGEFWVDLFFVISGFIMALITERMHQQPGAVRNFVQKRLFRVIPIYWMWTLVLAGLLAFLPQLFSVRTFSLSETLLSCLFIPYTPLGQNTSPVLPVGWTLSYEVYFYTLLSLGLLLSRKVFLPVLGLFFLASTLFIPQQGPVTALLSSPILWELYGGMLLYTVHHRLPRLTPTTTLMICLVALGLFYGLSHILQGRFWVWGLPALLMTGALVCMEEVKESRATRLGAFLGDSSYTLYLSHPVMLSAVGKVFVLLGLHALLPAWVQVFVFTLLCILLGAVLYLTTEKPITIFLNTRFPAPRVGVTTQRTGKQAQGATLEKTV